mgnify:CR=1 FL=1
MVEAFLHFFEVAQRGLLAFFVEPDAGDLLDHLAALDRGHLRERDDVALQHDVVAVRIDLRKAHQVQEFLARARLVVDLVLALAVGMDDARDLDLFLGCREDFGGVVEDDAHFRLFCGRVRLAAVVDEVRAARRTHALGARLAKHEAHGVDDVALARTIGANDAVEVRAEHELGALAEALEPFHDELVDARARDLHAGLHRMIRNRHWLSCGWLRGDHVTLRNDRCCCGLRYRCQVPLCWRVFVTHFLEHCSWPFIKMVVGHL